MTFNNEQSRIIRLAKPIYDGYLKTLTINTGQSEIQDLKEVYAQTLGLSGNNPEWSGGCIACVINCISKIYQAMAEQEKMTKASLADDEQPEPKQSTVKKPTAKKPTAKK